jgi:hypothetical protein
MTGFGNARHPPLYNSRQHFNALQLALAHHNQSQPAISVLPKARDWQTQAGATLQLPDQDILT